MSHPASTTLKRAASFYTSVGKSAAQQQIRRLMSWSSLSSTATAARTLGAVPVTAPLSLAAAAASQRALSTAAAASAAESAAEQLPVRSEPAMDLAKELVPGAKLHGFTVQSAAPYPVLNLTVYTLTHDASGAQYVHIARPDADNAFCVAFRTLPTDDTGVAHILEHTVLCGSQKFPVRDPFFLLLNRSLNTFMNAMTRPEVTFYPFSTQNEQDFKNLLSVYLDSVFFPFLDAYDFKQEGHRVEFADSVSASNGNANTAAAAAESEPVSAAETETVPEFNSASACASTSGETTVGADKATTTVGADGSRTISMGRGGLASAYTGTNNNNGAESEKIAGSKSTATAGGANEPSEDDIAVVLDSMKVDPASLSPAEWAAVRARASALARDGGEIYSENESDTDGEIDPTLAAEDQKVFTGGLSDAASRAVEEAEAEEAAILAARATGSKSNIDANTGSKTAGATVKSRAQWGDETTSASTLANAQSNANAADQAASAAIATNATAAAGVDPVTGAALPLVFKGVVFNEMKGALSDPAQIFDAELSRHLFPTSLYRNNSGGDPVAIPDLTHAQLLRFHRTFYHPANACFYTYGDLNPKLAEVDAVITKKLADLAATAPQSQSQTGDSTAATATAPAPVPVPALLEAGRPPSAADARAALSEPARFTKPRAVVAVGPDSALSADPARQSKFMLSWLCRRSDASSGSGSGTPTALITDITRPSLLAETADVSKMFITHPFVPSAIAGVPEADTANADAVSDDSVVVPNAPASLAEFEAQGAARAAERMKLAPSATAESAAVSANGAATATDKKARSKDSSVPVPLVPSFTATAASAATSSTAAASAAAASAAAALEAPVPALEVSSFALRSAPGFAAREAEIAKLSPAERAALNESMETIGLSLLSSLLVDSPASPLYDVLTDPAHGAGPAPGTGIELSTYEHPFSVGITGCAPEAVDASAAAVLATLEDIAESGAGLERENVHALLHLVEMGIKDASKNYGVGLLQRLVPGFVYGDSVHAAFAVLSHLDAIRRSVDTHGSLYFRALLRHHVLSNPHRLLMVMHASPDYAASLRAAETARLAAARAALPAATAAQVAADAAELRTRQERAPDPGCLPTLTVDDVAPEAVSYNTPAAPAGGLAAARSMARLVPPAPSPAAAEAAEAALARALARPVHTQVQPTNGVVYLRAVVDAPLQRLTARQLQLLPLLGVLLIELGVAARGRREHAQAMERTCTGVRLSCVVDTPDDSTAAATVRVVASTKALADNADKAAYLLVETLTRPDFTDHLYNSLVQYSSVLASNMQDNAVRYARADASSGLGGMPASLLTHYLTGLPHAQAVTALATAVLNETKLIDAAASAAAPDSAAAAAVAAVAAGTSDAAEHKDAIVGAAAAMTLPPGLTVAPSLARLANELAALVSALFLGPQQFPTDPRTGAFAPAPSAAALEATFAGELDCAPQVRPPATSPRGGLSRLLITADAASLALPQVKAAAEIIVDGAYWTQPVAYSPLLTAVADAAVPHDESNDSNDTGKFVSAEAWLKAVVDGNLTGAYVRKGNSNNSNDADAAKTATTATVTTNANGLKRRNYVAVPGAGQVFTVAMAIKTVPYTHPDSPLLTLLAEVLSARFLHREVREKGGAYGGFASHDRSGVFSMGSYRDPRSVETVRTFEAAAAWAREDNITAAATQSAGEPGVQPPSAGQNYGDREVAEAKLSLFSAIDAPEVPGDAGVYPWLRGTPQADRQRYRDALLAATRDDLRRVAVKYLNTHAAQITIVGPRDAIPVEVDESAMADGAWSVTVIDAGAAAAGAAGQQDGGSESE